MKFEDLIKTIYDQMRFEFEALQKQKYAENADRLHGYEDALWDLKVVIKDTFGIELPKIEKS